MYRDYYLPGLNFSLDYDHHFLMRQIEGIHMSRGGLRMIVFGSARDLVKRMIAKIHDRRIWFSTGFFGHAVYIRMAVL